MKPSATNRRKIRTGGKRRPADTTRSRSHGDGNSSNNRNSNNSNKNNRTRTKTSKPAASLDSRSSSTSTSGQAHLREGFRLFLQCVMAREADYLCGASRHARSDKRVNYRLGYYPRRIAVGGGEVFLRVPHLRYFQLRIPLVKRAKRLAPETIAMLARIRDRGVTPSATSALIKTVWTANLSAELLASLTAELIPILNTWRNTYRPRGTRSQPKIST